METEGKLTSYLRFEIFSLFGTHNPWDVLHEKMRDKDGGKERKLGFFQGWRIFVGRHRCHFPRECLNLGEKAPETSVASSSFALLLGSSALLALLIIRGPLAVWIHLDSLEM